MRQPSISVRICRNTSKELWQAAEELTKTGNGMPAYFNDERIVEGLCRIGVDQASADDYGIVGCYEASPQGAYSNTVAFTFHLYDCLDEFLERKGKYDNFDAFLNAFMQFYENYYRTVLLPGIRRRMEEITGWGSPFAGCCLRDSLACGRLPEEYGCRYTMLGLNILGIGILIDSIYTIKKIVYEKACADLDYLYQQTLDNFSDERLFRKIQSLDGAYGSDHEESNRLTSVLSELIGRVALKYRINENVLVSPALFWFTGDIWQREYHATANGRRKGELLSYGIMPCSTPHAHPITSILKSASHIRNEYFPNGCPLMITLMPKEVRRDDHLVTALIRGYFECGGSHFAANAADADVLEQARKNPQQFENLMVKISGYSARFVGLSGKIQEALIQRARDGF